MNISFREADLSFENERLSVVSLLSRFAEESSFPREMPETTKETLAVNLRKFPTTLIYFAEDNGTVVGIAVCFLVFSTFQNAPVLNLHDLYIRRDYRGEGVGYAFLDFIEKRANENSCCRITCEVYIQNRRAMRLYKDRGYGGGPDDTQENVMYALSKSLYMEGQP